MKPEQIKRVLETLYKQAESKGKINTIYSMSMFLRELGEREFMTLAFQWARALESMEKEAGA